MGDRSTQELVQSSPQLAFGLITFRRFSLTNADAQVRRTEQPVVRLWAAQDWR